MNLSLPYCVSFAAIHPLRLRDAFAIDRNFKKAGFVPLLKA